MIRVHTIDVTTIGTAGSATGSAKTEIPVNGRIGAIHLDYTSQAATADTTIVDEFGQTFLSLTNVNSDGWYYPHPDIHDPTGNVLNKHTVPFVTSGYITASVAQSNAGTLRVTILVCDN